MRGAERIANERDRQLAAEAFTGSHDDRHTCDELALAAAAYAIPPHLRALEINPGDQTPRHWPSGEDWAQWFKPMQGGFTIDGRIRELEKAGALVAAEIDRLVRLKDAAEKEHAEILQTFESGTPPTAGSEALANLEQRRSYLARLLGKSSV